MSGRSTYGVLPLLEPEPELRLAEGGPQGAKVNAASACLYPGIEVGIDGEVVGWPVV
ncbi:hypothetical protein [Kribbella voronezhensis]|uniref:hypothetical protein n=1 Tax=Kribbella voronezhensis TaxID=2512212 RepID=UPI0014170413|nr:hypothetical protein [Kribbella voronezhensis]